MKSDVSSAFAAHLAGVALTPAWCWMLKRRDGLVVGYTTHVEDLPVVSKLPEIPLILGYAQGTIICKGNTGFLATDIAQTDTLSQNNLDITAMLDDESITEVDLRAGLWRDAQLEVCMVNYGDLSMGTNTVFMGSIGNIMGGDLSFKGEQRGLSQPLEANMDGIASEMCNARVGDRRCGVNIELYRKTGAIVDPIVDLVFTDPARTEADGWWTKGLLTMTSGPSVGQTKEVKRSLANGFIELAEEFFFGFQAGDTYSITPGCNKLFVMADGTFTGDCKIKFVIENPIGNVRRFRGFRIPGSIKINQYGGQDGA